MVASLLDYLPAVARALSEAPRVLLGLDYDGTLTPIVREPRLAKLIPAMRQTLRVLTQCPNLLVAIVSGRALDDLCGLVSVDGLIYAGNHGLEISGPSLSFVETSALNQREELARISQDLAVQLKDISGALVDNKVLTVSIHYREVASPDVGRTVQIVEYSIAKCSQHFRLTHGKKVLEIRPAVDWHKGSALHWIREQIGIEESAVVYLGDDQTDEEAFRVLPGATTIKVGDPSDSAAQYFLPSPDEVYEFLRWIIRVRSVSPD